ncbi:MAG: sugar phosphate nucleotidyltransferase [Patescibacteria group bacterium]|jgi:bifunctional UDP-N-acetylglucosamine pyrophosphorylase/glucosamine-1-phosphate N-acetyltransferase
MEKYAAIILAAGKGTRMNDGSDSPIPKVMFEIAGEPIIRHSVDLIRHAGIDDVVLVVGYKKELIEDFFKDEVSYAVQENQLGTGHAAAMAKPLLRGKTESIIIFYGDNPLYKPSTVKKIIELYEQEKPTVAMLSVVFDDPKFWGFGRILRDDSGEVIGIVEQKDCTPEESLVKESNPGFYIFNAEWFWDNIEKIGNENAQHEFYLTDMIVKAKEQNKRIVAMPVSRESEALGINNPDQLALAEKILKERIEENDRS